MDAAALGGMNKLGYPVPGKPKNEPAVVDVMPVGPEFFHTMRIPLLAGREFETGDFAAAEKVRRKGRRNERMWRQP